MITVTNNSVESINAALLRLQKNQNSNVKSVVNNLISSTSSGGSSISGTVSKTVTSVEKDYDADIEELQNGITSNRKSINTVSAQLSTVSNSINTNRTNISKNTADIADLLQKINMLGNGQSGATLTVADRIGTFTDNFGAVTSFNYGYTLSKSDDGTKLRLYNGEDLVSEIDNPAGGDYLPLSGGTLTGQLNLNGTNIALCTSDSSSDDSGDIVFYYGNGQEKARIYTQNDISTTSGRLAYRSYKSDGTMITQSYLATSNDLGSYLPLSGGIVDGNVQIKGQLFAYEYSKNNSYPAIIVDKPGNYSVGIGADGTSNRIKFGPSSDAALGSKTWVAASTFNSNEFYFQGNLTVSGTNLSTIGRTSSDTPLCLDTTLSSATACYLGFKLNGTIQSYVGGDTSGLLVYKNSTKYRVLDANNVSSATEGLLATTYLSYKGTTACGMNVTNGTSYVGGLVGFSTTTTDWTGAIANSSLFGILSYPTIIRSSGNNLYHYRNDTSTRYPILDSSNYTSYAIANAGSNPACGNGTEITQPTGSEAALSIRTTTGTSKDAGILYLSQDVAYIANSADSGYTFGVFDTDKTVLMNDPNKANLAVMENYRGCRIDGKTVLHTGNFAYLTSGSISYNRATGTITCSATSNAWGVNRFHSKDCSASGADCEVNFVANTVTGYRMIGLSASTTWTNYASLGYCFYLNNNTSGVGSLAIYESGTAVTVSGHTTYTATDSFRVLYNNGYINYYVNGVNIRKVATSSTSFYADSDFYNATSVSYFAFAPSALGSSVVTSISSDGSIVAPYDNDFMAHSNEFNFVPNAYSGALYFNYRTRGGTNGNITSYLLGNGKGGALGTVIHSGNISSYTAGAATNVTNGGTITGQISKNATSISWYQGRAYAPFKTGTSTGYFPIMSLKTTNGTWDIGHYNATNYHDKLIFTYITDTNYNNSSNTVTKQYTFDTSGNFSGNAATATTATTANKIRTAAPSSTSAGDIWVA